MTTLREISLQLCHVMRVSPFESSAGPRRRLAAPEVPTWARMPQPSPRAAELARQQAARTAVSAATKSGGVFRRGAHDGKTPTRFVLEEEFLAKKFSPDATEETLDLRSGRERERERRLGQHPS